MLLELAKNIDAQINEATAKNEKTACVQTDRRRGLAGRPLTSPYKNEALALLKKYKPTAPPEGRGTCPAQLRRCHDPGRRGHRSPPTGISHPSIRGGRSARPTRAARSTRSTRHVIICRFVTT